MPDPVGQLLFQLLLILINAFFACSEIAVVTLNEKKIEKLSENGDKKATKLLKMIKTPERFLSTIQISITLAGFLGSAFAAENFAGKITNWLYNDLKISTLSYETLDSISIIAVTLVLSYVTLVLGELVPKRIAMKNPEKVAYFVCGIISVAATIAKPVVWFLSISTNLVLRLLKIDPHNNEEEVTEEEIRLMVDVGEENGSIESDEKEMIENIFEFNNITAADIMIHRTEIFAVDVENSEDEILSIIKESGYSRFPVFEESIDNIIGILSTRNFLLNLSSGNKKTIRELIYEPYFVPESVRADALFGDMRTKNSHMVIVLDEYGGTSGLVTMEDLLEEIVGNIYDETDENFEQNDIVKLSEHIWRINGTTELENIEKELGINFSDEDDELTTLSGLIFSRFTTIPADGETPEINIDRLNIKVENISEHRVTSAIVELVTQTDDCDEKD